MTTVADSEYTEPTNEQLAKFLVIYANSIPELKALNLQLSPSMLESMMSTNPHFRAGALRHHKAFQEGLNEFGEKLEKGELQCAYIRPNKKRCPNHNDPGSEFCGLHKDDE